MSKARIVKHLGKGRYKVMLLTDTSIIEAKITALNTRIALANTRINGELQAKVDETLAALNAIDIPEDLTEDSIELGQLLRALTFARTAYDNAVNALAQEKVNRENARDEKGRLEGIEPETERDIWCADYTTTLKPDVEVGVIDWYQYRERSTAGDPVIVPGYLNGKECVYNRIRDGVSVPEISMTTHGWWYAMCLVAGMERQNPHYRKATITDMNGDGTVEVTIDETYTQALGSQAKELASDELNLSNVPVHYLGVDSAVFEVGDRVVCEYPRKNFHKQLADQFTTQVDSLNDRVTDLNEKIADYDDKLAELQVTIDELQAVIDEKTQAIQDEQTLSGITELQNQITDLDNQISDLKIIIDDAKAIINDASSAIAGLNRDIAEKNAQLGIYIAELEQLIADGAPTSEIDAKQAQIDGISAEITALVIERNNQQSIFTLADIDRQLAEEESQDLQITRAEKDAVLFALLSEKTINQQELDIALAEMAYHLDKKTKLEFSRDGVTALLVDVQLQITKLTSFAADELGKYDALKVFTDTRPAEVTVVGFVDHPRPAKGLAFKDSAGNWKSIMPDGKETALGTPPGLSTGASGGFNWGVENEDGVYDAACIWNFRTVRVGGYNYVVVSSPEIIQAAGIIKGEEDDGTFIIKVITRLATIYTVTVKDGVILSTVQYFIPSSQIIFENYIGEGQEASGMPYVPKNVYTDVLIDKSGLFAVICKVADWYLFNVGGGVRVPRGGECDIYIYDLVDYKIQNINSHVYRGLNLGYGEAGAGSIYGDTAKIWDSTVKFIPHSMTYGVDGYISIVALTDVDIVNAQDGSATYSEVAFKDRNLIKGKVLYTDTSSYADYFNDSTTRFLCSFVNDGDLQTITMRGTRSVWLGPRVEKLILPSAQITLTENAYPNQLDETPDPGFTPIVAWGTTFYNNSFYDDIVLATIKNNSVTKSSVGDFSAGCVKVTSFYTPNLWVEFSGTQYKLVDKPSTEYTILI